MLAARRSIPVLAVMLLGSAAFAQESRAWLHAPLVQVPTDSAPLQRLGDFDGDGDLDVVGTRVISTATQNEVTVWANQQGALAQVWQGTYPLSGVPTGARTLAVATGDFNGDLLTDFVVGGGLGVAFYLAQPGLSFQTTVYPTSTVTRAVATGDFDGDGWVDVALAATGTLHVLLRNGLVITAPANVGYGAQLHAAELDGVAGGRFAPGQHAVIDRDHLCTSRWTACADRRLDYEHDRVADRADHVDRRGLGC